MNSKNSEGFGALMFVPILASVIWLIDFVPFRSDYSIYEIACLAEAEGGECPVGDELASISTHYRPERDTASVVFWVDGLAPMKYNNCAIVDTLNWSCDSKYISHHMVDGVLDGRTTNMGYPHFVKKWQWWWAKVKKM